jgi:hypothetical protein
VAGSPLVGDDCWTASYRRLETTVVWSTGSIASGAWDIVRLGALVTAQDDLRVPRRASKIDPML